MRASLGIFCAVLTAGCPAPPPGTDAYTAPEDAPDAIPDLGALPPDVWSYVPVEGARCGNGSVAAIGVNPHAGASELLIVIAGGGACWNEATCFTDPTAVNVSTDYTRALFDRERAGIAMSGFDDRTALLNPFREAHLVYVPYCTGDVHGGDAIGTYGGRTVHHHGGRNMQQFVAGMRAAWPSLATVRVIGFSAGGFGAQLNWGRFAEAWPTANLSILADCSPMAELSAPLYATWRAAWNLATPSDCTACAASFPAYDEYFDARYPRTRVGLTMTLRDRVLYEFWGEPPAAYEARVRALIPTLNDNPTTRYFAIDSEQHVITGDAASIRGADGTLLLDWVLGWYAGDARFRNVAP